MACMLPYWIFWCAILMLITRAKRWLLLRNTTLQEPKKERKQTKSEKQDGECLWISWWFIDDNFKLMPRKKNATIFRVKLPFLKLWGNGIFYSKYLCGFCYWKIYHFFIRRHHQSFQEAKNIAYGLDTARYWRRLPQRIDHATINYLTKHLNHILVPVLLLILF